MSPSKLRVGIKFCGHCNPQKHGPDLVEKLKRRLPEIDFVPWRHSGCVALLVISACPVSCVSKPDFEGPQVIVACDEVREWKIPPGHYAECLLRACMDEGLRS